MALDFDYKEVLNPSGLLENHIAREMFDDVKDYIINDLETELSSVFLALAGGTMSGAIAMGSNKITGLTNGTALTDVISLGQLKLRQAPILSSSASATSTTSTAFIDAAQTVTITPTSTSSRILIFICGAAASDTSGRLAKLGIKSSVGPTDLFTISNTPCFLKQFDGSGQNSVALIFAIDSPSTTSAVTYTTRLALSVGGGSALYSGAVFTGSLALMLAMEIE